MNAPPPPKKSSDFSAADYPALRSFLRGYFHQDMKDEYGSAEEAVCEFCADASPEERAAVAEEWSRFIDQTKGKSLAEINRILTGPLGSSQLLTSEEMQAITTALARALRKRGPD
jgi:hypothetical protein